MKHIVCFSGGHSSALVAVEVVRKYGVGDTTLLNHDISSNVEHADIKRFKTQVAAYLGLPITYANINNIISSDALPDQFDVVVSAKAFKVGTGTELCTSRLKTEPFMRWLSENVSPSDVVIHYGFDKNERARIQRRASILAAQGYKTDFPLALWQNRTIFSTNEIGIEPPLTYGKFKHANCTGCLKGGRQHWYITYCERPDLFEKGKWAEEQIGYTIMKDESLSDVEPLFAAMKRHGVDADEHTDPRTFWAQVRRLNIPLTQDDNDQKPCECIL